MSLGSIFLSVLLFLDCVFLIFLVLLQLPKKEAGAGVAFGGGTTDALFGAGSGNVLTKITKYSAGIFFALALILAIVFSHSANQSGMRELMTAAQEGHSSLPVTPATSPNPAPATTPAGVPLLNTPLITNSIKPSATTTPVPTAAPTNH